MTTIYALYKNDIPFYVGKSRVPDRRFNAHKHKFGQDIVMKKLDTAGDHVSEWKPVENAWISFYKVWNEAILVNKNDGGGGRTAYLTQEELDERHKIRTKNYRIRTGYKSPPITKEKRKQYEVTANAKAYRNKWWRENVKVNSRQRKINEEKNGLH